MAWSLVRHHNAFTAQVGQRGLTMNTTGNGAETRREDFGGSQITTTGETHTAALAAAAQAAVNARFVMAIQRPRDWDDVRVRLLKECDRPGFAEVARYNKPIGKGVKGPSIRFAEACFRYAGNLDAPVTTTFEDRFKRILHVQVIDFETNASYSADITIDKTVERRERKDRLVIAERKNSGGQSVFIVEATEDELLNKQNALVSKAVRTLILRVIPGDIVDEGQRRCIDTLAKKDSADPAGAKKRLVDAFADIGVFPKDLAMFVGHNLDAMQPAELAELREIYATVRDGEATWRSIVEARHPSEESKGASNSTDLEKRIRETPANPTATAPDPIVHVSTQINTQQELPESWGGPGPRPGVTKAMPDQYRRAPCAVCQKPLGDDAVPTVGGARHPLCAPFGAPPGGQ
jgi:hypothetical protein